MTDRAGALVGLAAGDVLGCGFEGLPPEAVPHPVFPRAGSRYTDDTQQALVLAYHLLRHGEVVPDRLAAEFLELARPVETMGAYRGTGPGFRAFVRALERGEPWEAAAPASAGNGAAMRVAPVAIRFGEDPEALLEQAIRASLVTHADPRGVAAAVALAAAVAGRARGLTGRDLVREAVESAIEGEHRLFEEQGGRLGPSDHWHTFSEAVRAAVELVGEPAAVVAAAVGRRAVRTSATGADRGTDAYALASVVTALVVAADPATDPPEAVRRAVALGGDADTLGAMVGAVRGTEGPSWPWEVPNRPLLEEVGRRLGAGEGPEGLAPLRRIEEEGA